MKKVLFNGIVGKCEAFDEEGSFMEISICSYDYTNGGKKNSVPYVAIMEEDDRGGEGVKCHLSTFNSLNKVLDYVKEFMTKEELLELRKNTSKYESEVLLIGDGSSYLCNLNTLLYLTSDYVNHD